MKKLIIGFLIIEIVTIYAISKTKRVIVYDFTEKVDIATVWLNNPRLITIPEYSEALFTGYTASIEECGKDDGITASGAKVQPMHTLACPNSFKFGTQIEIDGLNGIYVCEDRGGAIKGQHFDIYMPKKEQAIQWGKKTLKYRVIN